MSNNNNNNNLDERDINSDDYVGDVIDLVGSPLINASCDSWDTINLALTHLEARLSRVERALSSSFGRTFKATPLLSLIYTDKLAKRRINRIYENWISYMNYLARNNLNGITIDQTFWIIDKYIFDNFFSMFFSYYNLKISFIKLYHDTSVENLYANEGNFIENVKSSLKKSRNPNNALARPKEKEYISIANNNIDTIYILYYPDEISNVIQEKAQKMIVNNGKNDLQLNRHYHSLSHNIVGDKNVIGIKTGENKNIEPVEKGVLFMGSSEIFYNTILDANIINKFDENLYSMGEVQLNSTMILYHAMLHLKLDLMGSINGKPMNGEIEHDRAFINEFINYTPSVLYNHFMLPKITVDEKK